MEKMIQKFTREKLIDSYNSGRREFSNVDLSSEDLSDVNLSKADLRHAILKHTNLSYANLYGADLRGAYLRYADLSYALLDKAILNHADLSGAKGLPDPLEFMEQFEQDREGYFVFKAIGETYYLPPESWKIEAGAFLEEVVNRNPTDECGCGVNFSTREWCTTEFPNPSIRDIWLCKLHWKDLASLIVPYNTEGQARCQRLQLIRKLEK